jgi:ABC-type histidine transport system ATPase subunit
MGFARDVSSEVVFLHQGYIEEQGTPEDVLTRPKSERLRKFLASPDVSPVTVVWAWWSK